MEKIQDLFAELVRLMAGLGYISLKKQYIDGTKIEAASNKYTFVWKGSVEKYKAKLDEKIKGILNDIESAIDHDKQEENSDNESKAINPEELQKKIDELNTRL